MPKPARAVVLRRVKAWVAGYDIFLAFLGLFALASLLSRTFLTPINLLNVARQVSILGIAAAGTTFVIIGAGIDMSIGAVIALTSVVVALLQKVPILLVFLVVMLLGLLVGGINGTLVSRLGMDPFIVSFGMGGVAEGLAFTFSGGRPVFIEVPAYQVLGSGQVLGVPIPVWIFATVTVLCSLALSRTPFGVYVYSIGENPEAAFVAGINVRMIRMATYLIGGACAALSGFVLAGRMTTGDPGVGMGLTLDVITAVVVGGTQLEGGVGSIPRTLIGALMIGILNNITNLLGIGIYFQMILKGVLIVAAVLLGRRRR
ncbi:MAG: ABC transporter permease [Acetobacteraceae bacterium]|nr:ABC transporter permease [Acetobacteraceae bacterium]